MVVSNFSDNKTLRTITYGDAGKTIPELLAANDVLLAKDADSVDYDIDYLYNTAEAPYGEQLLAFLSAQN